VSASLPAVQTRVAHLINHFPAVSHSFIRREILALERLGINVQRISLRGWDGPLADAHDVRERERTRFVLREGALGLLGAVVAEAVARPGPLLRTLRLATRIGSGEVRGELEAARALVLAIFAEARPVVIMESMALWRPVTTTFVGGIPELAQPGESGWLISAGDIDALADTIVACIDASDDMLATMGASERERVLERHDIDIEAGKLGRLLRLQLGGAVQ
jgi:colanic acid/amylovoran biosynthesis glycosyltransferase